VHSGERFELALSVKNTTEEVWPKGSVTVGTEPSAFEARRWPTSTRPTTLRRRVPPGGRARLSWMMRAPEVEEPTLYAEFFYLDGVAAGTLGAEGTFNITVEPAPVAVDARPESPRMRALPYVLGMIGLLILIVVMVVRRR
jgi:hypothetical protein